MAAGAALFFVAQAVNAEVNAGTNLFSRGKVRTTLYAGSASALDNQYLLIGLGVGYYIVNGLQIGVDGEVWVGSSPAIYKVAPQILYVFYRFSHLKPYVGAFYRRTFYDGYPDLNSYGGRAGLASALGRNVYASFGVVYEKYLSYDEAKYSSYSQTYPEFSVTVCF